MNMSATPEIKKKVADWLAILVSGVALVTTICSVLVFAYMVGRRQAIAEIRIENLEAYTGAHEIDVREKIQLRTEQITEISVRVNKQEDELATAKLAIDRLQNQTAALQASQAQVVAGLDNVAKAVGELVTKQEVVNTIIQQVRDDLNARNPRPQ